MSSYDLRFVDVPPGLKSANHYAGGLDSIGGRNAFDVESKLGLRLLLDEAP